MSLYDGRVPLKFQTSYILNSGAYFQCTGLYCKLQQWSQRNGRAGDRQAKRANRGCGERGTHVVPWFKPRKTHPSRQPLENLTFQACNSIGKVNEQPTWAGKAQQRFVELLCGEGGIDGPPQAEQQETGTGKRKTSASGKPLTRETPAHALSARPQVSISHLPISRLLTETGIDRLPFSLARDLTIGQRLFEPAEAAFLSLKAQR